MLGLIEELSRHHEQLLVVGRKDRGVPRPCPTQVIENLESSGLNHEHIDLHALDTMAQKFRADLLHLHNPVNPQVIQWASQRASILTIQDHRFFCPGRGKWTIDNTQCTEPMDEKRCARCFEDSGYFKSIMELTKQRLMAAKQIPIHVLSEFMRGELVAVGIPSSQIHVLPAFVRRFSLLDTQNHIRSSSDDCVLFLGRLVKAKGVWDTARAWMRSGIRLPLVFAGTGPERQELERQGYRVLGWQNRKQVHKLLTHASVLVFSPRWQEPFGIAGIEALSLGTSVAAWKSGAIEEWYQDENIPSWGDVEGLSKKIRELSGKRPRFEMKRFRAQRIAQDMEVIYDMATRA